MSAVAAFLSSSNLHVLLCLLGGICCFLPVMTGAPSLIEESILSRSLESGFYYRDTSVALLALAVPLAADIGIDFFILLINGKKAPSNDAICFQCSVCSFQKLTCLIGIVIVPITAYLPGQYSNHALIYVCCNKCRTLIVGSIVMITLSQYIKKYWPVKSTLLFLALLSFGQIGTAFAENTTGIDSNKKLSLCAKISTLLAAIILVVSSFRCLYEVIHKEYRLAKLEKQILPNATGSERHYWSRILFSLLNLLIFAIVVLLLSVNAAKYDAMRNYTDEALLQSNVAYLIFELAFTIMTMRMIKFDVVRGLYALNDSKKSYVRYISHELRTPLNTAFLGLRLLTDDMKASSDPKDSERYDTLRDVNLSCKTVLDILNDLLCFDKLESGILELHKQEIFVVPFITDCVALFTVQARESNIKISVINTGFIAQDELPCRCSFVSPSVDYSEMDRETRQTMAVSAPIHHHESVLIDKFKMDQVVRNLLSNALKFTSYGGSISIKISHVPHKVCHLCDPSADSSRRNSNPSLVSSIAGNIISNLSTRGNMGSSQDLQSCIGENLTEGSLVIEVTDTGAGISKENQKKLFNNIVQFNPEILQAGGGSGLGLWITKGIVDLHQGKINVHSDGEGKGSSFIVQIPMIRRAVPDALRRPLIKRQMSFSVERCSPKGNFKSKNANFISDLPSSSLTNAFFPIVPEGQFDLIPSRTVSDCQSYELLVVDDSRLNRKMLCKILRGAGHICDEAEDGLQAVVRVKERMADPDQMRRMYDAILMDFVMPNMDGPTATKEICAMGYQGPIFGVTGNALDSDMEYFISCGALKIFTKPLDLAEFQLHMEVALSTDDR